MANGSENNPSARQTAKSMHASHSDKKDRGLPASLLFLWSGILAVASTAPWIIAALEPDTIQRPVYHMIASIQAFMTCLIAAFSFIWLQKRSSGKWLPWIGTALAFLGSAGTAATAWLRFAAPYEIMLGVSEICWLLLVLVMGFSALPKLFTGNRAFPQGSLIWLTVALVFGISGAVLVSTFSSIYVMSGKEVRWILFLGRGYLLQCMVLAALFGLAPLISGRKSPPPAHPGSQFGALTHFLCALLLALSIPAELWGPAPFGMGLRMLVAYLLIIYCNNLHLPQQHDSPLSWSIWCAAWLVPLGYAAAALTGKRLAGLHLVFIGGFTLGPLSVALDQVLPREEKIRLRYDRFLPVGLYSGLLILSLLLRGLNEEIPQTRLFSWGFSTALYIAGVLAWMSCIAGALKSRRQMPL